MRKRSIAGKRVTVTSGSRVRISVTPQQQKEMQSSHFQNPALSFTL